MSYFVYILYSERTDSFYKGQTNGLINRVRRHNARYEKYTKNGIPWLLIWSVSKDSGEDAKALERKLKNLNRMKFMIFLKNYHPNLAKEGQNKLIPPGSRRNYCGHDTDFC